MSLRPIGHIDLPEHRAKGGFDHAAIHRGSRRLYVAHTANDALDIIDLEQQRHVGSVEGLTGVAGALVDEASGLVFTSNRGEDAVGIFSVSDPEAVVKVAVGVRPNGLAYDPARCHLLAANIGDPADPASHTVSIVDIDAGSLIHSITVPGRTRWTVFDAARDAFFVNIAEPACILVIEAVDPSRIVRTIPVPAGGPHGLELDRGGRLFCACDAGRLVVIEYDAVVGDLSLVGSPDVIFLDASLRRLYVAIGDPGVIEVFDTDALRRVGEVITEAGAHTIALDPDMHRVYAFLPGSHRAAVFEPTRP